jgi:hypothetical protein
MSLRWKDRSLALSYKDERQITLLAFGSSFVRIACTVTWKSGGENVPLLPEPRREQTRFVLRVLALNPSSKSPQNCR